MKRLTFLILITSLAVYAQNPDFSLKGFASLEGGTTGGADGHIYSLGSKDGAALFKTKFFATRDILLKKYDSNGVLLDSKMFDFGKYEVPLELAEQNDGLVMITSSDETVNMGTNILNYFITKIDENMQIKWQIHFGTDSSGLGSIEHHKRTFLQIMPVQFWQVTMIL